MKKNVWIQLVTILAVANFLPANCFAQEDEDFAPTIVSPSNDVEGPISPGMAMPSDGEFEAAPAPSDWEDDGGGEDTEGEDF